MRTPIEKGDALHNAVLAIERVILANSPSLKEDSFRLEQKKVVVVDEVRHEIDVFVTVEPASGYSSVHIFECKNWQKSVGKAEIVDFSEKVRALNAAHGYFVAKSFTKYAKAQAKKDKRLTLLVASEHDPLLSMPPQGFHMVSAVPKEIHLIFNNRGTDGLHPFPLDMDSARLMIRAASAELRAYVGAWSDQTVSEDLLHFASGSLPEGSYDRNGFSTRIFEAGDFTLNGKDIETAKLDVRYQVELYRPEVRSHFSVETRGRVYFLAPVEFPQGQVMTVHIVGGPDAPPAK
jgi:Restriction endonuclease